MNEFAFSQQQKNMHRTLKKFYKYLFIHLLQSHINIMEQNDNSEYLDSFSFSLLIVRVFYRNSAK